MSFGPIGGRDVEVEVTGWMEPRKNDSGPRAHRGEETSLKNGTYSQQIRLKLAKRYCNNQVKKMVVAKFLFVEQESWHNPDSVLATYEQMYLILLT